MSKFINLSEASSIAIHSLVLISKLDQHINATQIAVLTGFSKNHLSKVLQLLVKYNYLTSNRGPKGGFSMVKKPEEVNLLEIYDLFEGKSSENHYGSHRHGLQCPFMNHIYDDIIDDISENLTKAFAERSIADIKWKEGISVENLLKKLNAVS